MAERQGFEPWVELPPRWFSRPELSTTQPPLLVARITRILAAPSIPEGSKQGQNCLELLDPTPHILNIDAASLSQ